MEEDNGGSWSVQCYLVGSLAEFVRAHKSLDIRESNG
jgi:hypothetical protein